MRVLMLTHNMDCFRGFWRAFSLARPVAALGHEVTVVASRRHPGVQVLDEERDGVRVVQMPDLLPRRVRQGGLSPLDLLGRVIRVRSGAYDVVHGFDHRPAVSVPALLARRWQGIPYVADWADLWGEGGIAEERRGVERLLGRADHWWERHTRRRADAVTAISSHLGERAAALGVPPERIRLLGVGANAAIRPLPKADMRARHGLPPEAWVLIHIGFAPYDVRLLADTFVALARRHPRVLLAMTGGRWPEFDRVVKEAGLGERVRHFGVLPYTKLGEVLACGDVMVLPYGRRGVNLGRYPHRLGDYVAAGRPVAINRTGDAGRLVIEERIGVAAEDDALSFAAAIESLLLDERRREEMGRRARLLAETRLSWRTLAQPLDELYNALASRRMHRTV